MFLCHKAGPAIARVPKNGSQSLYMALAPAEQLTNEEALQKELRVMFVRDPFDRLASAYSFFSFLKSIGSRVEPAVPDFSGYEGFLDWALESDDSHVTPQVATLRALDGTFVPNRFHWLREIHNVWNDYYPGLIPDKEDFPHRHSCQRLAASDYRRQDILTRYAEDFDLCQRI